MLTKPNQEEQNNEQKNIIYIGDFLTGDIDEGILKKIDKINPDFHLKIQRYRRSIQEGIFNVSGKSFSEAYNVIYDIVSKILTPREDPSFSRDNIVRLIGELTMFEC